MGTTHLGFAMPYALQQLKKLLISKLNQAELFFFIEQKLKEREPFYNQAKFILPGDELDENTLSTLKPKR